MSQDDENQEHRHHPLRERVDAARAAADEVVAREGGQLGGEVDALAVPFEELGAAVRAAIHPEVIGEEDEPAGAAEESVTPPAGEEHGREP